MPECEYHDPMYRFSVDRSRPILSDKVEELKGFSVDPYWCPKQCKMCGHAIKHKVGRIGFIIIEDEFHV